MELLPVILNRGFVTKRLKECRNTALSIAFDMSREKHARNMQLDSANAQAFYFSQLQAALSRLGPDYDGCYILIDKGGHFLLHQDSIWEKLAITSVNT